MRWFALPFVAIFGVNLALAQVKVVSGGVATGISSPLPPIAPVPYGFSNSVIDHNGRVVIFDVMYQYPPVLVGQPFAYRFPTMTTQVTIVGTDGSKLEPPAYPGAFQIIGVGRWAVYALVNDYGVATGSTQPVPAAVTRHLVALGPNHYPTLPSIDVPLQAQVKISAVGDNSAPDTIALVDNIVNLPILTKADTVAPSIPVRQRTVQIFQHDDGTNLFTPLKANPITIP